MTRRALLLGSATYGLQGVDNDIELMEDVLTARGFVQAMITTCTGKDATYHGMTDALGRLCRDAQQGDTVVVYYSGHGALTDGLQYLVPVDIEESTADDFRGLLGAELTEVFRRLTEKTPNTTCVLDCCHAGALVRGPGRLRLKSRSLPGLPMAAAHERAARIGGTDLELVPYLVRLAASQQAGSAYEAPVDGDGGRVRGLFTDALAALLRDPRTGGLPWTVLLRRVRDRVKQTSDQWPDAGGEAGRLPFSLDVPRQPEHLPLERVHGRFRVPGGQVLGLGAGDVLSVVFPDDTPHREAAEDHTLTVRGEVKGLDGADALVDLEPEPAGLRTAQLPPGAYAVPVRLHDRRRVHLDAALPRAYAAALREQVASCPRLALADSADEAFATVLPGPGGGAVVHLWDRLPARTPLPATPEAARDLTALLETLARGERLRALGDPDDGQRLEAHIDVRAEHQPGTGGGWEPLAPRGATLHPGDRYRLTVTHHSDQVLYAWIVAVGLSGRTELVTNDQPSGVRLRARGSGHDTAVRLGPVRLFWPEDVPPEGPRPETVHLLVGNRPVDFTPLVSRGARERARRQADHPLRHLLDELWDGAGEHRRDQEAQRDRELHYRVLSLHALMRPLDRA
ncbi:caspase family protein [Streptomyces longispororuber]|uniref:caspase family protein n=1 Tax=Streptomyces longispororuber TaxID=68230 RepID=UPI0033FC4D50